jgi:hypothetical protein
MSPVSAFRRAGLPCLPLVRVGLANTDDIHKSDAGEEQERNGDLVEHASQQDRAAKVEAE